VLVNYSETHDNERLASEGRAWSLLRNRLCALSSVSGAFGFTCGRGVAGERKNSGARMHGPGLGQPAESDPGTCPAGLLLREHPCFYDGAQLIV